MKILINGNTPSNSINEITAIMKGSKPDNIEVEGAGEYEGNVEWERLEITYGDNVVEFGEGYTGLWEMMSFDSLRDEAQITLSNDLLGWAIDQIKYDNEEVETLNKAKQCVYDGIVKASNITVSEDVVNTLHEYTKNGQDHFSFGVYVVIDGEREHISLHTHININEINAILKLSEDSTNQDNIRIIMEHLYFLETMYVEFEYYKYHSPKEKEDKED